MSRFAHHFELFANLAKEEGFTLTDQHVVCYDLENMAFDVYETSHDKASALPSINPVTEWMKRQRLWFFKDVSHTGKPCFSAHVEYLSDHAPKLLVGKHCKTVRVPQTTE